jgi:hypothetical protein
VRSLFPPLYVLLAVGLLLGCGSKDSPVEPVNLTGLLRFVVTIPCGTVTRTDVFVDGRKVGEMDIPGSFSTTVSADFHTFQIGSNGFVIHIQVLANDKLTFLNASFVCPSPPPTPSG